MQEELVRSASGPTRDTQNGLTTRMNTLGIEIQSFSTQDNS